MSTYAYDTEFLEDGHTIDLISIGIIADDGREYYAVSSEFDEDAVKKHPWLLENVWPQLPLRGSEITVPLQELPPAPEMLKGMYLDTMHPTVKARAVIAAEVRDFLLAGDTPPELWAYFGAYDHVAL